MLFLLPSKLRFGLRLFRRSLLCCALLGLPGLGFAQTIAPEPVQTYTLSNGLTLLIKPDHRAPTAVHMLWLRVGAMDEVDGTSGVAHALEHMMFKGSASLKPGEFSRQVAALGGRENAFTSRDFTGYYQQIPAARLEDVMRLEADRFAQNQWPDEEFSREIEVIKEERRLRTEDSPRALLHEQLQAMAFTASPYRRPIVGWMNDLDAMTAQDVRDFYQRWYVPGNAAVVVAGDVDVAQVRQLTEKYYGSIPAGALPVRKPRLEPEQRGVRQLEFKASASQAYVSLLFKVPQLAAQDLAAVAAPAGAGAATTATASAQASRDALALTVLAAVLDGYSGARLDRALVQSQAAGLSPVADSASAGNGLLGRGPQVFSLSGVPAAGYSAQQLADALRQQVALVARDGVTEAELQRVKTHWVAQQTYQRDGLFSQARELGEYWVLGFPPDASERLIAALRSVTRAEVQAVAGKYFGDDQLNAAMLSPQAEAAPRRAPNPAAAAIRD